MPTYKFQNTNTQEEFEIFMRISELDDYKKNHPELIQLLNGAPGLSDPVRLGLMKPSSGFREVLKNINKNNPGSNINTF